MGFINCLLLLVSYWAACSSPLPATEEEQHQLIKEFLLGNESAFMILMERNRNLIDKTLKELNLKQFEQEDVIFVSTIGLVKALKTYQLNSNISLNEYIISNIKGEIQKEMGLES